MDIEATVAWWLLNNLLRCTKKEVRVRVGACTRAPISAHVTFQSTQKHVAALMLEIDYLSQEVSATGGKSEEPLKGLTKGN